MSIFVSIEDKEGEGLAPVVDVDRIQRRFREKPESVCLRFISDEEDASFNRFQLPQLVRELDEIDKLELRADERDELTKILRLCRRFQDKPGVHARFYGERGRGE
jgi:hypothetical protein